MIALLIVVRCSPSLERDYVVGTARYRIPISNAYYDAAAVL